MPFHTMSLSRCTISPQRPTSSVLIESASTPNIGSVPENDPALLSTSL